jgi:hypothetical protein
MHYDLASSPTRHEQREGRIDRFGQRRPTIRVLTYYGLDNRVDAPVAAGARGALQIGQAVGVDALGHGGGQCLKEQL